MPCVMGATSSLVLHIIPPPPRPPLHPPCRFREAIVMACVMAATSSLVLGTLQLLLSPDNVERLDDFLHMQLHLP